MEKFRSREMLQNAENFMAASRRVGDIRVLTGILPDVSADEMRRVGDFLRDKDENVAAVLSTVKDDKITFLAVCGKGAVAAGIKAGDIIRIVCAACGGKGGGKPDSAMGGGSDVRKLDDALAKVDDFVAEKVNK